MEIKGMKGLHQICKSKSAGLSMPDDTGVGEDIQIVLKVDPKATKAKIRETLEVLGSKGSIFTEAKIEAHKDLA